MLLYTIFCYIYCICFSFFRSTAKKEYKVTLTVLFTILLLLFSLLKARSSMKQFHLHVWNVSLKFGHAEIKRLKYFKRRKDIRGFFIFGFFYISSMKLVCCLFLCLNSVETCPALDWTVSRMKREFCGVFRIRFFTATTFPKSELPETSAHITYVNISKLKTASSVPRFNLNRFLSLWHSCSYIACGLRIICKYTLERNFCINAEILSPQEVILNIYFPYVSTGYDRCSFVAVTLMTSDVIYVHSENRFDFLPLNQSRMKYLVQTINIFTVIESIRSRSQVDWKVNVVRLCM